MQRTWRRQRRSRAAGGALALALASVGVGDWGDHRAGAAYFLDQAEQERPVMLMMIMMMGRWTSGCWSGEAGMMIRTTMALAMTTMTTTR